MVPASTRESRAIALSSVDLRLTRLVPTTMTNDPGIDRESRRPGERAARLAVAALNVLKSAGCRSTDRALLLGASGPAGGTVLRRASAAFDTIIGRTRATNTKHRRDQLEVASG